MRKNKIKNKPSSVKDQVLRRSLVNFMNSFLDKCISCSKSLEGKSVNFECAISKKILKEIAFQCIIPSENDQDSIECGVDEAFPFCQECTELVSTLTDLYRQFKAIQEEFNEVRGQVARGIIRAFLQSQDDLNLKNDESSVFYWWQKSVRFPTESPSFPCTNTKQTELAGPTRDNVQDVAVKTEIEETASSPQIKESLVHQDVGFETAANFDIDQLVDIKTEVEEENASLTDTEAVEVEEAEEFLLHEGSSSSDSNSSMISPIVQLERLPGYEETTVLSKSFDHEDTNYYSDDIDSKSDSSDDYKESQKLFDNDGIQGGEDEYVPPFEIDIPQYRMTTRTRAKSLGSDRHNTFDSLIDKSLNDDSNFNSATDSDSETDSVINVRSSKRKRINRKANRKIKRPKLSKRVKSVIQDTEVNNIKVEGEMGLINNSSVKKKPKRIQKRRPVPCPICKKIIASKFNLTLHMRIHTGEKPYKCTYCELSFYKPSNLKTHLLKHTNERLYPCDICGHRSPDKSTLRCHKASQHDIFETDAVSECELCLKEFLTEGRLTVHLRTIHNPNKKRPIKESKVWCSFCEINFETIEELQNHKKTEDHLTVKASLKEIKKTDPLIAKNELKKLKRKKHEENDIKSPEIKRKKIGGRQKITERPCPECNLTFPDVRLLKMHQTKFHPRKERDFMCEVCGKSFTQRNYLTHHLILHRDVKPHVCNFCGEGFSAKSSLKTHLTEHTGEGLHQCEYCSKGFNYIRPYRKHLNEAHAEVHLKEKPFICSCCFLNFESEQIRSEHMSEHQHLKCKFCGRYCPEIAKLKNHIRIHTGERPHKCSICNKTFTQQVNLKEHENRHAGKRPFSCPHCEAGFFRRREMQNHIEKYHKKDTTSQQNTSQLPVNESDSAAVQVYYPTPTFTNL